MTRLRRALLALISGSFWLVPARPVYAQCSASDGVVNCSGSVGPVNYAQGYTTLNIFNLSGYIAQPTFNQAAATLTQAAAAGGDNQNGFNGWGLGLLFAGNPYGITSVGGGMTVSSAGGGGGAGKPGDLAGSGGDGGAVNVSVASGTFTIGGAETTGLFAQSTGGTGGDGTRYHKWFDKGVGGNAGAGGAGGNVTVNVASGTFNVNQSSYGAILALSQGGIGGYAGYTEATDGDAYGGAGGNGGAAGTVALGFGAATLNMTSQGGGAVVLAQGFGADGGNGGEGYATIYSAHGGAGGAGGMGGAITVTSGTAALPGTLSISATKDQQHALEAVSLGGSGGNGGLGHSGTVDGYGGAGGAGGAGGSVTVNLNGASISTAGTQALGIFARSYGGLGGNGGAAEGRDSTPGADGLGGAGGAVTVSFSGTLATQGSEGNGIFAQSVGGFSGDGGRASGFVAYGASEQSAGNGGDVSVTVAGTASTVKTLGDDADGITAQSVGGGGGKGSSAGGVVALGGSGAAGGSGGQVAVANEAAITTGGQQARAIYAASHGGGGGNAGGAGGVVAIGGASGPGGSAGPVTVTNASSGVLQTAADRADGLYAASIGGGGGSAHSTVGIVAIGGAGGSGGTGNTVAVQNAASIVTQGQDADAAFVHSVGGGGGAGSNAIAVSGAFSLSIGGKGGSGGDAMAASYTDNGAANYQLQTTGDRARGIFVQSVGGGGGDGGSAISANGSPVISIAIGASGSGGPGGSGGAAGAQTAASISTQGHSAPAVFVHSVGGGGGSSGTTVVVGDAPFVTNVAVGGSGGAGGSGAQVAASASGPLSTLGKDSSGLKVQSVGGGGGHSGITVTATAENLLQTSADVGGSGGNGGGGDAVTASATGGISTGGHSSYGIDAASIGGGGGSARFSGAFSAVSTVNVDVSVGGHGGGGGNAGTVGVTAAGSISTAGHSSPGVSAASVGGGGGDGATTVTATGISAGSLGTTVGGRGGNGGSGAGVSVDSTAGIATTGQLSEGIRAHSIGGGGGSSGIVVTANAASIGDIGVTVGGNGGTGAGSGPVTVTSQGNVSTQGQGSAAIDAKSIAGGGGSAKGSITTPGLSMGAITATVGGTGGSGGAAGTVSVTTQGAVATQGPFSYGVVALSLGGAGGEGGFAAEAGLQAGDVSGSLNLNIGGAGGGGSAAQTTVNTQGSIKTADFGATGILAHSIGGNGGIGGSVYSGNVAFSATGSAEVTLNAGGNGGSGAVAGEVKIDNAADLSTSGSYAPGIDAKSIGGGGGTGATVYTVGGTFTPGSSMTATVSVGGSGGTGNHAGIVDVTNSGKITTTSGGAIGIEAASIGGGGGRAGNAASINVSLAGGGSGSSFAGNVNIGVGGSGGAGGDGKAVTVQNQGAISTAGLSAPGIHAHSIGGGGGNGGTASSFNYSLSGICKLLTGNEGYTCTSPANDDVTRVKLAIAVEVGGSGGAAGDGDVVTVDNTSTIATTGDQSHGIYAKSIGGGGGNGGGGSTGISAWTTNNLALNIQSLGATFTALPNFTNINVAVGGAGGASGDGGDVAVNHSGAISTTGHQSFGIHAQSVGGGGGDGGAGNVGMWGKIAVGGLGSGGGTGGTVTVTSPGSITTSGDGGVGIFAQSVGGGGGTAGDVEKGLAHSWENLNIGIGVGIQLNAGKGGDGGAVSVTTGAITTTGAKAHGVMAQSVGGSGGMAAITGLAGNDGITWAGSSGDAGNGGAVSVTVGGPIAVSGESAHGVFAHSVSGSGAADKSGNVTVDVNADIRAMGSSGRAILAQSAGTASSGAVVITVAKGVTVATGADGAETIGIKGGTGNLVTNNGTITQGNDASYAIRVDGTTSPTQIVNNGTITGQILGASTSVSTFALASPSLIEVRNQVGGTINAGALLDVARIVNDGTLAVGGSGRFGSTQLPGDLVQSASGVLAVDVYPHAQDGAGSAAVLAIDGRADLAGRVAANLLNVQQLEAGLRSVRIATAAQGMSLAGLEAAGSAVARYRLEQGAPGELRLGYDVDFANQGILARTNDNQDALVRHLRDVYRAGALDDGTVRSLLAVEDTAAYARAMNGLSAELAVDTQMVSLLTAIGFNRSLVGCGERGDHLLGDQDRCGWVRLRGQRLNRDATQDNLGFAASGWQIAGGGQVDVGDAWAIGGAFAYDRIDLKVDDGGARSDGDLFQAGLTALRRWDATDFYASVNLGFGSFDHRRTLVTGSSTSATERLWFVGGRVGAAHAVPVGRWVVKPRIDLGAQYLAMDGYQESGGGGLLLKVDSQRDTYVDVTGAVEFMTDLRTADGLPIRPSFTLGVTQFLGSAAPAATGRLVAAPGEIASFTTRTSLDKTWFDARASVDVLARQDMILRAEVFGSLASHTQIYGAGVWLSWAF